MSFITEKMGILLGLILQASKIALNTLALLLQGAIKIYQFFISPLLGKNCRFSPTCSEYASEAISKFGPIKGSWMSIRRLMRCHPFSDDAGGDDPIITGGKRSED